MKVAILGTRYEDLSIEEAILGPLGVTLVRGVGADADEIADLAGDARVVVTGSGPRLDAELIERLDCVGIVRSGVGVDRIDLDAARARGVWVARVSDYGTEAVAVHTVVLALAGIRRLTEVDRWMRNGSWGFSEVRPLHLPSASTAGVIGYGRIGKYAAELLAGLGFNVLAHDTQLEPEAGRAAGFIELLERSDVVTLHVPGQEGGEPLLGSDELMSMKPGSVLVNTARGSLVDTTALVEGLKMGQPRVAALDVFPAEPPDLAMFGAVSDRMILTPHMSWYTEESERLLRERTAEDVARLIRGERPREVVVEPVSEEA